MTKSSCISHPKREPITIIRRWQVQFCQGNKCAAALLAFYEYWHNIKLDISEKNTKANDIAEQHGDDRYQDESLLQFHSLEKLSDGINGLFGKNTISRANQFLCDVGAISVHPNPNPKYTFDKTKYILFHPETCNEWLDQTYPTIDKDIIKSTSDKRCERKKQAPEVKLSETPKASKQRANAPQKAQEPEVNSDLPDLGDRSPKIGRSCPNFGTSYPKIGRYKCKEITAEITTEKAAANELEEIPKPRKKSSKQKSAAAFSCDKKINTMISSKLTPEQQGFVKQRCNGFYQKHQGLDAVAAVSGEEFVQAVMMELLDTKSFKHTQQDFKYKLNTILSEAKKGAWDAAEVLGQAKQKQEELEVAQHAKVSQGINQLKQERFSVENTLNQFLSQEMNDELLIQSYQREIKRIDKRIEALKAEQQNHNLQTSKGETYESHAH